MKLLSSLTNRIFLASAALAVLSIGASTYFVNAAVSTQAENQIRRDLDEAAALVEHYRNLVFEHFAREAELIADLPKLKAAVAVDHAPTVLPLAEDYQRRIGADLFVVTNAAGGVLAGIGESGVAGDRVTELPAVQRALAGWATTSFWPRAGGVLQVVTVPIWIDPARPELLGTLSVGFSLDESMALRFKQLTASEIAFAVDGQVQATTLPDEYATVLGQWLGPGGDSAIVLGDEEYAAVSRPLSMASVGLPGGAPERAARAADAASSETTVPVAVILRSRTEQLRFLRSLQTTLAGTALMALLGATLLSYGVARTVTQPLGTITTTMREMAASGDLTRRIRLSRHGNWDDEDTRLLATTFNAMTESISRFQREAALRERLSALGRLSTIVAHEIRNPLMIIKASVRALRRPLTDTGTVRQAAEDIDEEVGRLDRIVSEVLDFARPLRFELDEVDLNALCIDAAAAAEAGERPSVRVTLDPDLPMVVSDSERLRQALVNVLTNAQQAVLDRLTADGQAPERGPAVPVGTAEIDLVTERLTGGGAAIRIRDRGPGIAPDDVPRVFDPYFTTRRTGSGLGLAIAKNIVEGLGGTLTVHSRVGEGTEMRIELPLQASPAPASPSSVRESVGVGG